MAHGFQYNPGLVQSLVVNAPLAFWLISRLYREGHVSAQQTICAQQIVTAFLCVGIPGQPLLLLSPMLAQRHGKIGMAAQHAFQFTSMVVVIVPEFSSLAAGTRRQDGGGHATARRTQNEVRVWQRGRLYGLDRSSWRAMSSFPSSSLTAHPQCVLPFVGVVLPFPFCVPLPLFVLIQQGLKGGGGVNALFERLGDRQGTR